MQRQRPAFPVRLDTTGTPVKLGDNSKKIANNAVAASGEAQKSLLKPGTTEPSTGAAAGHYAYARARMVARLAALGVAPPAVLAALGQVERHRFVDSALAAQAYEDTSLPIGWAQTISKPSVVARMAALLCEAPITQNGTVRLGRVLEIGSGCGYQAAVLARLATEVYSIERVRGLHELARVRLRPLRLANLHLLFGDGMQGFERGAPYAAIISAAGGAALPPAWTRQLAPGGRLIAPIEGGPHGGQALVVLDKTDSGVRRRVLEGVHFVPLKSGIA